MSRRGLIKLAGWIVFGTLSCLAISVTYNYFSFRHMDPEALRRGLISATVLPILLAVPFFTLLTLKLRELAIANHKLNDLASTDGLTGCLNRRAFTAAVERALENSSHESGGAMLVIDADRFKAVNDRFGHDLGDEALKLVAEAIRAAVRDSDLVSRLGGEEFGVFLARTQQARALEVAERIRAAVAATQFVPNGTRHRLSVSIGCAVDDGGADYILLFRAADQSLYEAKRNGRNRIEVAATPSLAPELSDIAS